MPPFAPVADVFQQPDMFQLLDEYLNTGGEAVESFLRDLSDVVADPEQKNYGPFATNQVARDHWLQDWIKSDEDHSGGTFWPYLTEIDIYEELRAGLASSVQRAVDTGKQHTTVWLPHAEAPAGDQSVTGDEQHRLFKVAVHETAGAVQLVILTPQPIERS